MSKRKREPKPDTASILSGLKDFQRATVDYVYRRLYTDPDKVHRFLVADEVGLGKTLVARGVIAKAIDHLWSDDRRIDVIYVCSNAEIARQNIARLNVTNRQSFSLTTRLTLLALTQPEQRLSQELNFIAITPNTSFELNQTGQSRERQLLHLILTTEHPNLHSERAARALEGDVDPKRFREQVANFLQKHPSPNPRITSRFWQRLQSEGVLLKRFEDLCAAMPPRVNMKLPDDLRKERTAVIGALRRMLAEEGLRWLEPDLVILDEFQRFKDLLGTDNSQVTPAMELAQQLFNYRENPNDPDTAARVLLLSATPYKMFTMRHESQRDDHYADFQSTLKFLFPAEDSRQIIGECVEAYRQSLLCIGDHDGTPLIAAKQRLEVELRKVISRTERLACSIDRGGMLAECTDLQAQLRTGDIKQFVSLQTLAKQFKHSDMLAYFKSAPYLLNFMDEYEIKREINRQIEEDQTPEFCRAFKEAATTLLTIDQVESYGEIDPANAQLRSLHSATIGHRTWQLLWMPAARPYYAAESYYARDDVQQLTKYLIFSCWKVVPKVVASLLSYSAEREMFQRFSKDTRNTADARKRRSSLLRFGQRDGVPLGMSAFALLTPCRTLATKFQPLQLGTASSSTHGSAHLRRSSEVIDLVAHEIAELLKDELAASQNQAGEEDHAWYWAAMLLLDKKTDKDALTSWLHDQRTGTLRGQVKSPVDDEGAGDAWQLHIQEAQSFVDGDHRLGRPPADLCRVLARMTLGAPGICTYRALANNSLASQSSSLERSVAAMRIANSFLHLFNLPEVTAMVRDRRDEVPYWRSVLDYCIDGNLQAVLDEYMHLMSDAPGVQTTADGEETNGQLETCSAIAMEISQAIELRTSTIQADTYVLNPRSIKKGEPVKLRTRFAMHFGDQRHEDAGDNGDSEATRKDQVRTAFNSPFWPFVLATTSVGQEGLDFHRYCHSIVHWNLPSNPVDLEQREGRVHRYKGHALRKNIAHEFGGHPLDATADLWCSMFSAALSSREATQNDLYPYWIAPGPYKIRRHIPALPHSREQAHKYDLLRTLTVYRMVFGQSRQEDLVQYLLRSLPPDRVADIVERCRISLAPS